MTRKKGMPEPLLMSDLIELGTTTNTLHTTGVLASGHGDAALHVCALGYASLGYRMRSRHNKQARMSVGLVHRWYSNMKNAMGHEYQQHLPQSQKVICPVCKYGIWFFIGGHEAGMDGLVMHLNDYHKLSIPEIVEHVRQVEVDIGLREVLELDPMPMDKIQEEQDEPVAVVAQ